MEVTLENPEKVTSADIVVGIPSYCEEKTISFPTEMASRGLKEFFSRLSSAIINVDNDSPDNTKKVFMRTPTEVPKIYLSTPPGLMGKGENFLNLFEAAVEIKARAVVVVDADLKSITPHWIQSLAEPLLMGYDFVTPIYVRHKYDATVTNNIAYPMTRTLYGIRVRQPIAGDFGFSGRLARAFLVSKIWDEEVSQFGIDVWMTTIAIARGFKVCQSFLGSPKIHNPKDPAKSLGPMFKQVVGTIFEMMIHFDYIWKDISESKPTHIFGFGLGETKKPPPVSVDTGLLHKIFYEGNKRYKNLWKRVFSEQTMRAVRSWLKLGESDFYMESECWARVLFDYAVAYRDKITPVSVLLESLIPLYMARTLSFVNRTKDMQTKEAEEYLENISRVFEGEKDYLIGKWEETRKKKVLLG